MSERRGPFRGVRVGQPNIPGGSRVRRVLSDLIKDDMLGEGLQLDEHNRIALTDDILSSIGGGTGGPQEEVGGGGNQGTGGAAILPKFGDMHRRVYDPDYDGVISPAEGGADSFIEWAGL